MSTFHRIVPHSEIFLCFFVFYLLPPRYVSLYFWFKATPVNDIGSSTKDGELKIDNNVILCEEEDGNPNVVSSATFAWADSIDPDKF